MKIELKTQINLVLLVLIVLDVGYAVTCFFLPQVWYSTIHGVPYDDPQALLRRTGAIWAAFSLFQLVALIKWQQSPYWMAIITGVRLSEIFADWAYVAFAQNTTPFGQIALLLATPANILISVFFFRSYLALDRAVPKLG